MNLIEIFSILIIHWIADFVLQTDWQAKNKSKNKESLINHTFTYSALWLIVGLFVHLFIKEFNFPLFALITFIAHTITDYYTSRLNSRLWEQGKVHNFFVAVGFDQVLHYIQLFLTYWFLVGKN